jgi:betaine lipid synthase
MDHMDWFEPENEEASAEIAQFHRVLSVGGMIFWRSAAKHPWYNDAFRRSGFELTAVGMREGPEKAIDSVNMYASFWRAVKL